MFDMSFFIKSITIDEENRIVVVAQDLVKEHLANEEYRKKAKDGLKEYLGDDFKTLEISSNSARITVAEGKAETCKEIIETELKKLIDVASQFLGSMGGM